MSLEASRRHSTAALPLSLAALPLCLLAACVAPPSDTDPADVEALAAAREALSTDGQICVAVQRGTSGAVADANLWQTAPLWNDGDAARLSTGTSEQGGLRRSLLRFDLPTLPAGADVVSATLSLHQLYREGGGTLVEAFRATAPWDEPAVTWDSFAQALDPTPIGSFITADSAVVVQSLDVRALVNAWIEGAVPNHGLVLSEQGEGSTDYRSSDSPYLSERPRLEICYVTCDDGVQNGAETGLDCGGGCAQKCADGAGCVVAGDCQSDVCTNGVCQMPVCGDGVVNGSEACDDGGTSNADRCSSTCALQEVLKVTAGASHSCALLSGGKVKCWGDNASGQLGLGDTYDRGDGAGEMGSSLSAVPLGAGKTAVDIAAGGFHTCARLNDGALKCWGSNYYGQLGIASTQTRGDGPNEMGDSLPAVVLGAGRSAVQLDLGWTHACALLDDGTIKCWGRNNEGQLGLGSTSSWSAPYLPVDLGTGKVAVAVSAGDSHTCALLSDGAVKCWGGNFGGRLGLGDTQIRGDGPGEMGDSLPAVDLGTGETAEAIVGGSIHTCARLTGGRVKCWGFNAYGQLGLNHTQNVGDGPNEMGNNLPLVDLGTGKLAADVVAGGYHTCARFTDSSVKCWGRNNYGQLGLGDTLSRGDASNEMGNNLPVVNLGAGKTAAMITTGADHVCAQLNNGSAKCWGYSLEGQLGQGHTSSIGDWWSEVGDGVLTTKLFSSTW